MIGPRGAFSGGNGTNCSYSLYAFPGGAGYSGYVIRAGDKLFLRQWQSSGAHGGMNLVFGDGTNTNWAVTDQDGNQLNNDGSQQTWHYRRVDLSQYAGKTVSQIYLVQESTTGAGSWDIYFNDITLSSTDGTVRPIYSRQTSVSLSMSGTSGVSGRMYEVHHLAGITGTPDETTNYYAADQIGSARLVTNVNGYPVWQATYLPFGYEYNPQAGVNKFKFTDYQRDSESGLDYAKFRYYNSTVGRFMSPDPLTGSISNPQSWNRYAYVLNNPLKYVDPLGLDCVYLSDDAMSIEEVDADTDTSQSDCGSSGGSYVPGSLTGYGTNDDGTISNFTYTPYPDTNTGDFQSTGLNGGFDPFYGLAQSGGGAAGSPANNGISAWIQKGVNYLKTHPVTFSFTEGLSVQVTYHASTKTLCVNAGLGASVPPSKMVTAGVLNEGNMEKWTDVQSGWGYSFGANVILGYQGSFNSSGKVGGPTVSGIGVSGSYTYGWCQ